MTLLDTIEQLTVTLQKAGHRVIGVSMISPDDRSTWRVDTEDDLTDEEHRAIDLTVQRFDPTVPKPAPVTVEAVIEWQAKAQGLSLAEALDDIRAAKSR